MKGFEFRTTQDRLNIFVSSRLQECAAERDVAQRAIASIRHHAVLFEHVGARSYSPRELYLSRLRDSQAMIAIYKCGYGWIDEPGGMTISGLEDELRFAQENGIDTLFYISRSGDNRDSRLQVLIEEIQEGPNTVYFYEDPQELENRISEDVTAFVTDNVLSALSQRATAATADPIGRVEEAGGALLERRDLLEEIERSLNTSSCVVLWGNVGTGKSTSSAQFARKAGGVFVSASNMSPLALFAACGAAIVGEDDPLPFVGLEAARSYFAEIWAEQSSAMLVVDDCAYISELHDAIEQGGGTKHNKRILFTSREPSNEFQNLRIPDLTAVEQEILGGKKGDNPPLTPLAAELQRTFPKEEAPASQLAESSGLGGEIARTLAISGSPLTAEVITNLRGDGSIGIEELQGAINSLGHLVTDTPAGFQLFHEDFSAQLVQELQGTPQRLRYYANPLIRYFSGKGDFRQAHAVASLLRDGSEQRFTNAAAREAAIAGDWKLAEQLLLQLLDIAIDDERRREAFQVYLALIYPLELMGKAAQASEFAERAEELANELGEMEVEQLKEALLSSKARRSLSKQDVEALGKLHNKYRDEGRDWDQARLALDISVLYLAAKEATTAATYLRPAIEIFGEIGDEYGLDLAQRNLVSALTAEDATDIEAETLMEKIAARSGDSDDQRRQRAWLANIMTRKYRKSGRLDDALKSANEAIAMALELGDESLRALNLVNLGNVYVDRSEAKEALKAYIDAGGVAQKCGRRDLEADASRLAARTLIDFHTLSNSEDRFEQAQHHATYAIGLLKDSVSYEVLARAHIVLAEAIEGLGDSEKAAKAYFVAADNFRKMPDAELFGRGLTMGAAHSIGSHNDTYLCHLEQLLDEERPTSEDDGYGDRFLDLLRPIMKSTPRDDLIRLLTLHLSELWEHLDDGVIGGVTDFVLQTLKDFAVSCPSKDSWRVLYSGVALTTVLCNRASPFHQSQFAETVKDIDGIYVRECLDGSRDWTIVLDLAVPVTVSITPLDSSSATNIACIVLAMFMKGFEKELYRELIDHETVLREASFMVGTINQLPDDIAELMRTSLSIDDIFSTQTSALTRSIDNSSHTPTFAILRSDFLESIELSEGDLDSLPLLFGQALTELAVQLLGDEVNTEELTPRVVKLVGRALR